MLLVVQSRIVIHAQDALKFKKKWFTKMAEWSSKPRAPRNPHSSLYIRITNVNIMSLVSLYIMLFFLYFLFSVALIEMSPLLCSLGFYVYSKFPFLEMLCVLFKQHM